jgi:anti-anti-sigma factor
MSEVGAFCVDFVDSADEVRLNLRGEFDMAGVDLCQRELDRAHTRRAGRIVLDLSDLTFIDSTGLRTLVQACGNSDGKAIELVPGPAPVQRVFALTGLLERLPFVDGNGR